MIKVIEERLLTIPEAREILEDKSKKFELSNIEQITLSYLQQFSKVEADKAKNIVKRLVKELDISVEAAVQLVNIMPKSIEEIRTILIKERFLTTEELQKILQILHE
ncbi:MAG: hypothetical protein DRJ49_00590 [Thermoprotei archaeon]|nr:MAG: hypothetical protein DRN53_05900 [Thermoprotei archaeon]RLE90201.1 MAG: hypothetical protein DRJ49_00590 [Thermoprotei archaeon]